MEHAPCVFARWRYVVC